MTKPKNATLPNQEAPSAAGVSTMKAAKHVTVACKVPHGIIMQLCHKAEEYENTPSGPRKVVLWHRFGEQFFIRGTGYPRGALPEGFPERGPMASGFALTHNIPAEVWDQWKDQHRDSNLVKNNLIFAMPSENDVRAMAKENTGQRTGLEPLDVSLNDKGLFNDPRAPRPTPGITIQGGAAGSPDIS